MIKKVKDLLGVEFILLRHTESEGAYLEYKNTKCTIRNNVNIPDEWELSPIPDNGRCFGIHPDYKLEVLLKDQNPEYFI